jgi:hypothetical protein
VCHILNSIFNILHNCNIFTHRSQDKDGYVSQQDYKLAKRFDLDGNGVIDAEELVVAKKILSEEFFARNSKYDVCILLR